MLVQTGAFALLTLLRITSDEIGCGFFVSLGFAGFSVDADCEGNDAGGEGKSRFGVRPDWPFSACAKNSKTQNRANSRCKPSADRRVLENGKALIFISPKYGLDFLFNSKQSNLTCRFLSAAERMF